jgi:predicted dehydrogenase
MGKYNVGIIGVGRMGRRHIEAVRNLGWTLCGVCDIFESALEAAKNELGLSDGLLFNNLQKFYKVAKPECLVIATTADSHCQLTCQAAKCGVRYILVEKPMAVSLNECDKMIDVCSERGVKLSVNHQMRFMEQYTKPREFLQSEAYGGIKSMTVVAGNFGFAMNGSHYFEAFRFLTNEVPTEVSAWFSDELVRNPRGARFSDRAGSIRVVTGGQKRLYIEIGADQGHGLHVVYAGRNGIISVDELSGEMFTSVRESEFRDLPTTRYGMPSQRSVVTIKPAEVVDSSAKVLQALVTGDNSVTADCGRLAIATLVAAYTSAENRGAPISLDAGLDRARMFPWA